MMPLSVTAACWVAAPQELIIPRHLLQTDFQPQPQLRLGLYVRRELPTSI